jgi:hypothetical protein
VNGVGRRATLVALVAATLAQAPAARADALAVSAHADAPPAEVAASVGAVLRPGGARVAAGGVTLDFWWVGALATSHGAGAAGWRQVAEGSLVGAVRISAPFKEIRGKTVKAGVYTLRFALQPANGDHLGVSPHREFLLIVPAAADVDPGPIAHDRVVELSAKALGTSHPAAWSLDPPVSKGQPMTVATTPDAFESVVFEIPLTGNGTAAGALRFGLVLVGHIEA